MNVDFPGFGGASAFWLVIAVMLATAISMIGFFRYKRWL
jgi:Mg2+ and Co2+ transporter CorA